MDTISRVLDHITLVFISTTYQFNTHQHFENDGNLHALLSKTMSTTDIVMTRSVPAADTGTTITRTEEPSMLDLGVILGVLSSTESVEYCVR